MALLWCTIPELKNNATQSTMITSLKDFKSLRSKIKLFVPVTQDSFRWISPNEKLFRKKNIIWHENGVRFLGKVVIVFRDCFLQTTDLTLKGPFLQNFSRPSYLTRKQSQMLPEGAIAFKAFFVTRQLRFGFTVFLAVCLFLHPTGWWNALRFPYFAFFGTTRRVSNFETLWVFHKRRPEHILKTSNFLSLRYGADFRRSRLVYLSWRKQHLVDEN